MKNILIKLITLPLVAVSFVALAATEVIIEEEPAVMTKQGEIYITPAGSTANYFTYTEVDTKYTCTVTAPSELTGVKSNTIKVKMDGETKDMVCYESKYFVVK